MVQSSILKGSESFLGSRLPEEKMAAERQAAERMMSKAKAGRLACLRRWRAASGLLKRWPAAVQAWLQFTGFLGKRCTRCT